LVDSLGGFAVDTALSVLEQGWDLRNPGLQVAERSTFRSGCRFRERMKLSTLNGEFVAALGDVKDRIGEWHDWEELFSIGRQVIQHSGCHLIREIQHVADDKFAASPELHQQNAPTIS
jgi:hypothetical protein